MKCYVRLIINTMFVFLVFVISLSKSEACTFLLLPLPDI